MRPLARLHRAAVHKLAALGLVKPGLDRVVVVEHAVDVALLREADAEVGADGDLVGVDRVTLVRNRAVDDRLVYVGPLGQEPALDGELLEEVLGVCRPELEVAGHREGVDAVEVQGLATGRVVEPERVGRGPDHLDELDGVGRHVAVGVVAFVLLEAEGVVQIVVEVVRRVRSSIESGSLECCGRQSAPRHVLEVIGHHVVLRYVARRGGALGEPERRRVGVAVDRIGDVREYALLVVPYAVSVGVDHGRPHAPRIQDGVVRLGHRYPVVPDGRLASAAGNAGERRVYPLVVPSVEPGKRQLAGALYVLHVELRRDDVASLAHEPRRVVCIRGRRAEDRVEAVEHLVVVVHSVRVGVGDTRVSCRVARYGDVARDHEALGDRVHVERDEELAAGSGAVPGMARRREVAGLPPSGGRPWLLVAVSAVLHAIGDDQGAGLEALLLGGVVRVVRDRLARYVVYDLDDLLDARRDGLVVDERPAVPRLCGVRGGVLRAGGVEDRESASRSVAAAGGSLAEALRVLREERPGRDMVSTLGKEASHERGRHVVVAEVAHRLGHVLLVVLESVMVEVDVAHRAQEVVP